MGEFDLIEKYFAPMSADGAFALKDDVARQYGRVLTKDLLVEGTHFLPSDPLDLVARKALRTNMSDLIAKGATPEAYMLGLVWPRTRGEDDFARFASGLRREFDDHDLPLLGGDTTRGEMLVVSVTMFGRPFNEGNSRQLLLRTSGQPGDILCVSGTIGDGLLGLEAAKRGDKTVAQPYHLPEPPFGAEALVAQHARASIDVSDGLIADAQHLCRAGELSLQIQASQVPLSEAGRDAAAQGRLKALLTGGDDYQTLCLVPPDQVPSMRGFTVIGKALDTASHEGVQVTMPDGTLWQPERGGWDHFA